MEGKEIEKGRQVRVGTITDLKKQKAEYRNDKIPAVSGGGSEKHKPVFMATQVVRRPAQPGTRGRGSRRGGLGFKVHTANISEQEGETNTNGNAGEEGGEKKAKNNADFKAMFLKAKE